MIVAPSHGPLVIDIPPSLLGKIEPTDLPPDQQMNTFAKTLNEAFPGLDLPTYETGLDPDSPIGRLWAIWLQFLEPEAPDVRYKAKFDASWAAFPPITVPNVIIRISEPTSAAGLSPTGTGGSGVQ